MKKIILILIFALTSKFGHGQTSVVIDALRLDSLLIGTTFPETYYEKWAPILGKYCNVTTKAEIQQCVQNNPFLKDFTLVPPSEAGASQFNKENLQKVLNGLAQTDVTSLADGVAKFLVQRTKEEIAMSFLEKMRAEFLKYPEFEILFPNTHAALFTLPSYTYPAFINHIRNEFDTDMQSLPNNFYAFISVPDASKCQGNNKEACIDRFNRYAKFSKNGDAVVGLGAGTTIFSSIMYQKKNPADVIEDLSNFIKANGFQALNINSAIRTSGLISNSLRSTNQDSAPWISMVELTKFKDQAFQKLFFGLLYELEETENIKYEDQDGNTTSLKEILASQATNLDSLNRLVTSTYTSLYRMQNIYIALKHSPAGLNEEKKILTVQMLQQGNALANSLQDAIEIVRTLKPEILPSAEKTINLVKYSFDLSADALNRDYQGVILNTGRILQLAFADTTLNFNNLKTSLKNAPDVALSNNEAKELTRFLTALSKFGGFLASITEAENSDQIKNIIEQYALPTGSSVMKKYAGQSFALNAHAGAMIANGDIRYKSSSGGDSLVNSTYYGFSAPLGFSYNWSLRNNVVGSISLFAPLVDIGPLFGYRLTNETDSAILPPITLQQIWSPGIMLQLTRLFNTPLALTVGPQWQTLLNKVGPASGNTYYENGFWTWRASLTMDIPLLYIFRKNKGNM